MNNGLSGIKNIIWALAIVIALLALLVGLIFTVATRSYGDAPDGTLVLSSGSQAIDSRGSGLDADPYSLSSAAVRSRSCRAPRTAGLSTFSA